MIVKQNNDVLCCLTTIPDLDTNAEIARYQIAFSFASDIKLFESILTT